jgi:hypothetical protein
VQNPGKAHMDAAHHVLRYFRATYDQAIVYERTDTLANTIWGWVDSDWAADLDSRRSHTGYCSYTLMLHRCRGTSAGAGKDIEQMSGSSPEIRKQNLCLRVRLEAKAWV